MTPEMVYLSSWPVGVFGGGCSHWPEYAPPKCWVCGEIAVYEWFNGVLTCDSEECVEKITADLYKVIVRHYYEEDDDE